MRPVPASLASGLVFAALLALLVVPGLIFLGIYLAKSGPLIARIGRPALLVLKLRLKSADDHDRRVAAELLARIGPADAALFALLRPLLDDRDQYVRQAAIEGLGAAGPAAKKAVADLERVASNDPILLLRVGTRIALVRVAGASDERVRALAAFLEMKDELDARPKGEQKQSARGGRVRVGGTRQLGYEGKGRRASSPP